MLKNLLKEMVRELVKEALGGFSISKFKAISANAERNAGDPGYGEDDIPGFDNVLMAPEIDYAEKHLPLLGEGSSRITYALDSAKVLKIALNRAGEAQNETEAEIWFKTRSPYITTVYDFAPNNKWIISEIVKPIEGEDITKILGVDQHLFQTFLNNKPKSLKDILTVFKGKLQYSQDILNNKRTYLERNDMIDSHEKESIEDDIEFEIGESKNLQAAISNKAFLDFMKAIIDLANINKLQWGDIHKDHFGRNAQGQLKLFDFGYSSSVAKSHYGYEIAE